MPFSRFSPLIRRSSLSSPIIPALSLPSLQPNRCIISRASLPMQEQSTPAKTNLWKPMCLYYTHGNCTKMDDLVHTDKFSHNCSSGFWLDATEVNNLQSQEVDFFLVLDLEGKVEILEYPVLLFDAKTMNAVDFFHRFVRPTKMSEHRINQYIEGKYGKLGVDRVWHDNAISFNQVIEQFEEWLIQHHLWEKVPGGHLNKAAFVTCGNWDLKTKVPDQCGVSGITLPSYFTEWINLKIFI